MLGDLGVSSLHSIKTMTQFSSLFGASNQPCWETRFSSRRYSTFFSFSSLFWIIMSAILPATMLGYYS
jgi:hypothetical protein